MLVTLFIMENQSLVELLDGFIPLRMSGSHLGSVGLNPQGDALLTRVGVTQQPHLMMN